MDIITCIYKSLVITKMIVILVELGKIGKDVFVLLSYTMASLTALWQGNDKILYSSIPRIPYENGTYG